jgi:hypothetical protein
VGGCGGVDAGSSRSQADRQVQLILISQHQRRAMLTATNNQTNYVQSQTECCYYLQLVVVHANVSMPIFIFSNDKT